MYDGVLTKNRLERGYGTVQDRRALLEDVFRRHHVRLAYLFGSMAEPARRFLAGGQLDVIDPLADIDVGVVFEDPSFLGDAPLRRERYSRLFNDLTEVFPEGRLDLVFLQETHSVFQSQAMTGVCVYAVSPDSKASYEERILARAADFRPFLERYYDERLGGVLS